MGAKTIGAFTPGRVRRVPASRFPCCPRVFSVSTLARASVCKWSMVLSSASPSLSGNLNLGGVFFLGVRLFIRGRIPNRYSEPAVKTCAKRRRPCPDK